MPERLEILQLKDELKNISQEKLISYMIVKYNEIIRLFHNVFLEQFQKYLVKVILECINKSERKKL